MLYPSDGSFPQMLHSLPLKNKDTLRGSKRETKGIVKDGMWSLHCENEELACYGAALFYGTSNFCPVGLHLFFPFPLTY